MSRLETEGLWINNFVSGCSMLKTNSTNDSIPTNDVYDQAHFETDARNGLLREMCTLRTPRQRQSEQGFANSRRPTATRSNEHDAQRLAWYRKK